MNTWIRKVEMGALALALAGVLGGCNDGNGRAFIRLFFGINGSGSCTSVVVDVDLEGADAVIARDSDGDVQCVLNAVLQNQGCDIVFEDLENGHLRATISGCSIPGVINLFSCLFEDVDLSSLNDEASAQCDCGSNGCDPTPPVCISPDPDPTSCEDCENGIDDDDDGLTDCEDPNCENFPGCGVITTTTSTSTTVIPSSTVTTSTTTSSSTTTTITLPTINCNVIFRLADDVSVGSLQWTTDYSDAPGGFLGQGGSVECASLIEGSLAAFNDTDNEESLESGLISLEGFTGPVNVAECTFAANVTPLASQFGITVTEASHPDLTPVEPLPGVVIQSITCETPACTDNSDCTSTQFCSGGDCVPKLTDGSNCTDDNQCLSDNCVDGTCQGTTTTTGVPGNDFEIQFTLDTASSGVGALQWTADYASAPGGFQDSGAAVKCFNDVAGALFAPNDVDATSSLTLGLIALTPFNAPTNLVHCTFNSTGDAPVPGDFGITIDDATDTNGDPITATIGVTVGPCVSKTVLGECQ